MLVFALKLYNYIIYYSKNYIQENHVIVTIITVIITAIIAIS